MIKGIRHIETQKDIMHGEKAHKMNPDRYKNGRIILKTQDEEILHEAILTYINTLSYNACWDFIHKEELKNGFYISEICFKWNGCIRMIDACAKLKFRGLQTEWIFD